jgi:hypothetical protein
MRSFREPDTICDNGLRGVAAVSSTDVWAVGYCAAGPISEHWNGAKWTYVQIPYSHFSHNYDEHLDSSLSDVAASPDRTARAVGNFGLEKWSKNHWQLSGPRTFRADAISIISPNDMWALGPRPTHYACR